MIAFVTLVLWWDGFQIALSIHTLDKSSLLQCWRMYWIMILTLNTSPFLNFSYVFARCLLAWYIHETLQASRRQRAAMLHKGSTICLKQHNFNSFLSNYWSVLCLKNLLSQTKTRQKASDDLCRLVSLILFMFCDAMDQVIRIN